MDSPQKGDHDHDGILTPADAAIALRLAAGGSAPCDPATLGRMPMSVATNMLHPPGALVILQAAAGRAR